MAGIVASYRGGDDRRRRAILARHAGDHRFRPSSSSAGVPDAQRTRRGCSCTLSPQRMRARNGVGRRARRRLSLGRRAMVSCLGRGRRCPGEASRKALHSACAGHHVVCSGWPTGTHWRTHILHVHNDSGDAERPTRQERNMRAPVASSRGRPVHSVPCVRVCLSCARLASRNQR